MTPDDIEHFFATLQEANPAFRLGGGAGRHAPRFACSGILLIDARDPEYQQTALMVAARHPTLVGKAMVVDMLPQPAGFAAVTALISPPHAWYMLWLVPFLCFVPSAATLYLTLAATALAFADASVVGLMVERVAAGESLSRVAAWANGLNGRQYRSSDHSTTPSPFRCVFPHFGAS